MRKSNFALRLQPSLMEGLKKANVEIDRKMLADIAVADSDAFGAIVEKARSGLQTQV